MKIIATPENGYEKKQIVNDLFLTNMCLGRSLMNEVHSDAPKD